MPDAAEAARQLHRAAATTHAGIELPEAAFVERVLAVIGGDAAALGALHGDDLFVAHAAVLGDPRAVLEIDRRLRAQIAAVVKSLGESRGFADDLEGDLRDHVLAPRETKPARLASYTGKGPLDGWLRVTITREALRARKHAGRSSNPLDDDAELPDAVAPELEYLKAAYRDAFRSAFRAALATLDDRQRNLIALHYGDGVGVEQLGQMYRVHFSTISRWIAAARDKLFDTTRDHMRAHVPGGDEELAEIMALLQSRLDVTISLFVRDR
ncbi:MAG TPA: sigma-70 family RNA polymerase sigma factor [Kofleriaceae bacterium]|nr:sigma-70 family RNA polymerase sigma factor [Kofleriaceae bacterium]